MMRFVIEMDLTFVFGKKFDYMSRIFDGHFVSNQNGPSSIVIKLAHSNPASMFLYYSIKRIPILVHFNQIPIWKGFLLDVNPTDYGFDIVGVGLWQALKDLPYTNLIEDRSTARWIAATSDELPNTVPDRYELDNNNRLYAAPLKDSAHSSSTAVRWYYLAPQSGNPVSDSLPIEEFTFDYEIVGAIAGQIIVEECDNDFSGRVTKSTTVGNGSGSISITGISKYALIVTMYYSSSLVTYTGENGAAYLKITNLRIRTHNGSITAAEMVGNGLAPISALNNLISDSAAGIDLLAIDVEQLILEEADFGDVLGDLALVSGKYAAVFEDGLVVLATQGSIGLDFAVTAGSIDLVRSFREMAFNVYVVYEDQYGAIRRTSAAVSTNANNFGFMRSVALQSSAGTLAEAEVYRDAALDDLAEMKLVADVVVERVSHLGSVGRLPMFMIRPHDLVQLQNVPGFFGDDLVESFYVGEVKVDFGGQVIVSPARPIPSAEIVLAQQGG